MTAQPIDDEFPAVCWHCLAVLMPEPLPHCDQCPPAGECDVEGCTEPGCTEPPELDGIDTAGLFDTQTAVECELRLENRRMRNLLHRVIDDANDLDSLKTLARDIRVALYGSDPTEAN